MIQEQHLHFLRNVAAKQERLCLQEEKKREKEENADKKKKLREEKKLERERKKREKQQNSASGKRKKRHSHTPVLDEDDDELRQLCQKGEGDHDELWVQCEAAAGGCDAWMHVSCIPITYDTTAVNTTDQPFICHLLV